MLQTLFTNTYDSVALSTKFSHEFIKIMLPLDPIPFAQLSDTTPQYLLRSHLLQHGLELLHSWQTASVLDSNTPLVNYICFPFFFSFCLSSLVKLCAERCFMTNSIPREVHFIHPWKWAAMWTAVKWLIFLSSSTTQPPPWVDVLRKTRKLAGSRESYSVEKHISLIRIVH